MRALPESPVGLPTKVRDIVKLVSYARPMGFMTRRRRAHEVTEVEASGVLISAELKEFVRVVNTVSDLTDPAYLAAVEQLRRDGVSRVSEIEELTLRLSGREHAFRQCLLM
jgi:hypothetical protein